MQRTDRKAPQRRLWRLSSVMLVGLILFSTGAAAEGLGDIDPKDIPFTGLAGATALLAIMIVVLGAILTSRRLQGSSLFNRLFIVVAVTSAFFSGIR